MPSLGNMWGQSVLLDERNWWKFLYVVWGGDVGIKKGTFECNWYTPVIRISYISYPFREFLLVVTVGIYYEDFENFFHPQSFGARALEQTDPLPPLWTLPIKCATLSLFIVLMLHQCTTRHDIIIIYTGRSAERHGYLFIRHRAVPV